MALASLIVALVALATSAAAVVYARREAVAAERQMLLSSPPDLNFTESNHQPVVFLDYRSGVDLDMVTLESSSDFLQLDFVDPDVCGSKVNLDSLRVGDTRIFTPYFDNGYARSYATRRYTVRIVASTGDYTWPPFVRSFELFPAPEEP